MATPDTETRDRVAQALRNELERAAPELARVTDLDALTDAVMGAIGAPPAPSGSQGKRPEDLDATNDD